MTDKAATLIPIPFGSSWVWQYFALDATGRVPPPTRSSTTTTIVCRVCLESKSASFKSSLVSLHKHTSSNAIRHVQTKHPKLMPDQKTQPSKLLLAPPASATPHAGPMQALLSDGRDNAIALVHASIARFIVNRRLPLSIATDPDLTEIIHAATALAHGTYKAMTRTRMDNALALMFRVFVDNVTALFAKARAVFVSTSGSVDLGWLTICHDGWDATTKQYLGVSVYWIDMESWETHKIALGLAMPADHSAGACAAAVLDVLRRFGVTQDDIFRSFNDTTNAAVATGRLLAGEDGTCHMHVAQLVADHATGKKKRTSKKVVVDSFDECDALRCKVRDMIGYIWNKKVKSRAKTYVKRNDSAKQAVIRVAMDNATRIGGTERMYQQTLRSRWCLNVYFAQEPSTGQQYHLTDDEWETLAQVQAVLRPICALAFTAQIDSRVVAGASWPNIVKYVFNSTVPQSAYVCLELKSMFSLTYTQL